MRLTIQFTATDNREGYVYVDAADLHDPCIMQATGELESQGFEVQSIDTIDAPRQVLQ